MDKSAFPVKTCGAQKKKSTQEQRNKGIELFPWALTIVIIAYQRICAQSIDGRKYPYGNFCQASTTLEQGDQVKNNYSR